MAAPRYKPRSEYQTRNSDQELEGIPDFAATALDRPAATEADLKQAQLKQDVERDRRARGERDGRRRGLLVVSIVIVALLLALGSALGAYLALR